MSQLKEYNNGMRYMLTVIDVFSKFAFVNPLINKRGPTVLNASYDILEESNRKPTKIQSDAGTGFTSKGLKVALQELGIKYYVTFSENKSSVVERFNRTLKIKIWKYFTHENTYRYVDVLKDLVDSYKKLQKDEPTRVSTNRTTYWCGGKVTLNKGNLK